ncbi:hypothetical protein PCANC_27720 [Puccinia coronata f. sp. avenae]|uniref:Uncharacterized protein n=1 Tax=Puccinia coronata f. sp. avenae TaxID=200324 RepID=A0A2N5VQ26_9BASI|nr:hypothetical protein PCANC_27720 [Puccinia coronata f. sp. avenae]PLW22194.1 hypothetical protein PCASD_18915 [Puccinia coronata f. sp. avenae]PLW52115.1 hypothetical protein PCASD_02120 [Puccinia coronata f. sp. avenae]
MRWGKCLFLTVSAIIVGSATGNFNVPPFAQLGGYGSETVSNSNFGEDIPELAELGSHLNSETNDQLLSSIPRDCYDRHAAAINNLRDDFLPEYFVAPLA